MFDPIRRADARHSIALLAVLAMSACSAGDGSNGADARDARSTGAPGGDTASISHDARRPAASGAPDPIAPTGSDTIPALDRIDASIPAPTEAPGEWGYRVEWSGDIDADGVDETVVLTARVGSVEGRPAWDDGQAWAVHVVDGDSAVSPIYRQRLQLGTLALRVTAPSSGPRTIVLIEHLPDRLRLIHAEYRGPGDVRVTEAYRAAVDPRGDTASPRLP